MDSHWAAEHLEVIRTLMERTAVYRRALAPVTLVVGGIGLVGGAVGWLAGIDSPRGFGLFWLAISVAALGSALLIVRRQALRDREPFWSPPTRQVTRALVPPLGAGLVLGLLAILPGWQEPLGAWWLPAFWMLLYGCALSAAGFFMPRGIRLFGHLFVLLGCLGLCILAERGHAAGMPSLTWAHLGMAGTFGGLHLTYGCYLLLTERGKEGA
jgi:hypothetical protein